MRHGATKAWPGRQGAIMCPKKVSRKRSGVKSRMPLALLREANGPPISYVPGGRACALRALLPVARMWPGLRLPGAPSKHEVAAIAWAAIFGISSCRLHHRRIGKKASRHALRNLVSSILRSGKRAHGWACCAPIKASDIEERKKLNQGAAMRISCPSNIAGI